MTNTQEHSNDIAIIGMSIRFPGANDLDSFWENLRDGVESMDRFSDEELLAAGVSPDLFDDPNFVRIGGVIDKDAFFDASYFDYTPREAKIQDPQQRLFLECCAELLDLAGYDPDRYEGRISVVGGAGYNCYLSNIFSDPELIEEVGGFQAMIHNEKDFLCTRVGFKLNLRGPCFTVQTACSTSLVALHLSCQSLLNFETDIALAGGVSIRLPQKIGYLFTEGFILSPDGHCRAFDADAKGTNIGCGLGVVALKRLDEALADGDIIHAIVKGSAINNDGLIKVGWTAPSVSGQAEVISEAISIADISADSISYVEAHGTGTVLGDPIEVAGLTKAFRGYTDRNKFCALGSVKSNIGHLDTAAGVAGLVKTVLAMQHGQIPPSLFYKRPNPKIDFENTPFYVCSQIQDWPNDDGPRRAGVSSFGVGGTNAHVVLEEAPIRPASGPGRALQLIVLSARSEPALDQVGKDMATHLRQVPGDALADIAFTLNMGRRQFSHRAMLVCESADDALNQLEAKSAFNHVFEKSPDVCFMFSGQGSQYPNMGRSLYESEPCFRKHMDHCFEVLAKHLDLNLGSLIYPKCEDIQHAADMLRQTRYAQPAIFTLSYALAQLWMSWGISPKAMIGHSIGEYVAATVAGVFDLDDALALVAERGALMQAVPKGAMLAVSLSEKDAIPYLGARLSLAAINGPKRCVVAGSFDDVEGLATRLKQDGVACSQLHTSHAFHSHMFEPIIQPFAAKVRAISCQPPSIPYVSNLTGTWITDREAQDPFYWAQHLRRSVRFSDGIRSLCSPETPALLEVGPGKVLSTLAFNHPFRDKSLPCLFSLPQPQAASEDLSSCLSALGKLWAQGVVVDWSSFYASENRRRLLLPTYPFEKKKFWVEERSGTVRATIGGSATTVLSHKEPDMADWFYAVSWKRVPRPLRALSDQDGMVLIFLDKLGLGEAMADLMRRAGKTVFTASEGPDFTVSGPFSFQLNITSRADFSALLGDLAAKNCLPSQMIHCLNVTPNQAVHTEDLDLALDRGFYSLLFSAQSLGEFAVDCSIAVISNNTWHLGGTFSAPVKATITGPIRVIGQEYAALSCRGIDIALLDDGSFAPELPGQLVAELDILDAPPIMAVRHGSFWVQGFDKVRLEEPSPSHDCIKEGESYLITGGLGGLGLALADHLANTKQARLVLLGRTAFPEPEQWDQWLSSHDNEDPTSSKILRIKAMIARGSDVLVLHADVTDEAAMTLAFDTARARFGSIYGVFHMAGVPSGGMIQAKTRAAAESVLNAKVYGTLILSKLLQADKTQFLCLASTLISVQGGLGQIDTCSANAFLDAFADQLPSDLRVCSICFDAWKEVGMSARVVEGNMADLTREWMTPQEGVVVFGWAMGSCLPQVLVSTSDLHSRFQRDHVVRTQHGKPDLLSPSEEGSARPDLSTDFVAPMTDTQLLLAEIWQSFLGILKVGIHDDFFELGGDSLLATQLFAKIREVMGIALPMTTIFDEPTLKDLAEKINRSLDSDHEEVDGGEREEGEL